MAEQERKRRRRKTEYLVRFTALLMLAVVVWMGNHVYAKYFSESARWGVAIASGVYFSANYAAESSDTSSGEYFESVVNNRYTGVNTDFNFEVRNYENNILFNESGVVIPYSLSFWLGEAPEDATYTINWQGGTPQTLQVGQSNKITIENQTIEGGTARAVQYTISILTSGNGGHEAVPVFVEVRTDAGALISKTLRGKMVLNNTAPSTNYIETQEFVVSAEYQTDAEKFAQLAKQAMLTYEIRTVGEVAAGDVTEKLKLSWNPAVLEIDLFDESFVAWQKGNVDANGTVPLTPWEDAETGWYYITLDVMPYSAQTTSFFKGEGYAAAVTDMETLNNCIKAEKYNVKTGKAEGTE